MKIARCTQNGKTFTAIVKDGFVHPCTGDVYAGDFSHRAGGLPISSVRLETPSLPTKIVAVGNNYSDHIKEIPGNRDTGAPVLFLKPPSALATYGQPIIIPQNGHRIDLEAELCFVISKPAKNVKKKDWRDYVLGFCCFNDVSDRDIQKLDGQWTRAKGFDSFAPYGPWIETDTDPGNLGICSRINGKICQNSNTKNLMFPPDELMEFITASMTLLPGDVVSTGTPPGVAKINPGDLVEIEIETIGTLANPCR